METSMQVLDEESKAYFNFINSLNSESTRNSYKFCLEKFLIYYKLDLASFLQLPTEEMSNLIIKYLVDKKISRGHKNLVTATLKHLCEINDIVLNWKKIKKFINSEKTGNEANGRDRAYTHEEIQKILDFCDQRMKTIFLILASIGLRIGALQSLRLSNLNKIDNLYKITVYSGDNEEYFTLCTPEAANEIDIYLDFRKRHGEKLTGDSFLVTKKFDTNLTIEGFIGQPFGKKSLPVILEDYIRNSGLRNIDHANPHKRKEVPRLHGFRKFFTTQCINAKLNPEIREMLLGHKIGLASCYYKPTEQEMLDEYMKAVNNLTINEENRLKIKIQKLEVEKSRIDKLEENLRILQKGLELMFMFMQTVSYVNRSVRMYGCIPDMYYV
jgi:integrase